MQILKTVSFFLLLSILFSCNSEQAAKNNAPKKDQTDTTATAPEPETDYTIKANSFMGIALGSEIANAKNLKKGILKTGEGDFEVYYILAPSGEELGYTHPQEASPGIVKNITVTSPLAKTEQGAKVGMTYGELEKMITDFEVHGSEIESRTYVEGKIFSYRLDAINSSYNLDKASIAKDAKVLEISIK